MLIGSIFESSREVYQMKYHDVIIRWSKIATILFIAMVLVGDIFGLVITKYICWCWAEVFDTPRVAGLTAVYYLGTAGTYVILFSLLKLLFNMGKDKVFDRCNTKLMNVIAYTFVAVALDCLIGGFIWSGSPTGSKGTDGCSRLPWLSPWQSPSAPSSGRPSAPPAPTPPRNSKRNNFKLTNYEIIITEQTEHIGRGGWSGHFFHCVHRADEPGVVRRDVRQIIPGKRADLFVRKASEPYKESGALPDSHEQAPDPGDQGCFSGSGGSRDYERIYAGRSQQ